MSVEFPKTSVEGDSVTLVPERWAPHRVGFAVEGVGRLELRVSADDVVGVGWWFHDVADPSDQVAALVAAGDWAFAHGARRLEALVEVTDTAAQRRALAAGYVREGLRRGMPRADGARDMVPYARLPGDPVPAPRLLPDLPGGALTDGVVVLRPLTAADTADTYRLRTLPEVVDSFVPPVVPTEQAVSARCAQAPSAWLAGSAAELTVRDASAGVYAGEISVHYRAPSLGEAMVGYALRPEHRGRGYASRALVLVARWVLGRTGVERLVAGTVVGHVASQRVLERAGFRREGVQRARLPGPDGTRRDTVEFCLLRADLP